MGNPQEFIELYKDYRRDYTELQNKQNMADYKDWIIAKNSLDYQTSLYVKNVIAKDGFLAFVDYVKDAICDEKADFSKVFLSNLKLGCNKLSEGELKTGLTRLFDENKKETMDTAFLDTFVNLLKNAKNPDELKKFTDSVTESVLIDFRSNNMNRIPVFDLLLSKRQPEEDITPDKEEYQTYFEKEFHHPFEKEIAELKAEEEKKEKKDEALIQALEASNHLLTDLNKDGITSTMAEAIGRKPMEIMEPETKKLTASIRPLDNKNKKDAERITDYYHNNVIGSYHVNKDFNDTVLEMIDYARKNHLVQGEEAKTNNEHTTISDLLDGDSKKLENAIKEKNTEDIKKYAAILSDKEEKIDHVIRVLKTVDPDHLFIANKSTARTDTRPAKYRIDVEGATLFNQIGYISDVCSRYDINPKDMLEKPVESLDKMMGMVSGPDSTLSLSFKTNDPFNLAEKRENLFGDDFTREMVKVNKDIVDLAGCITSSNPLHRAESDYFLGTVFVTKRQAFACNNDIIKETVTSNRRFYNEILPAMILIGKDFDVFHMIKGTEPMIDISSMTVIPDFNLKDYLKKNRSVMWEGLVNQLKGATLNLSENYGNSRHFDEYYGAIQNAGNVVREVLTETCMIPESAANMLVDEAVGIQPMTPIQRRTVLSQCAFAESMRIGIAKDGPINAIREIASLERRYNSHNFLAHIFYKNLRAQKAAIDEMKNKLVEQGVNRAGLEKAIEDINHHREEMAEDFAKQYKGVSEKIEMPEAVKEKPKEGWVLEEEPVKQPFEIREEDVLENATDILDVFDDEEEEPSNENKTEIKPEGMSEKNV